MSDSEWLSGVASLEVLAKDESTRPKRLRARVELERLGPEQPRLLAVRFGYLRVRPVNVEVVLASTDEALSTRWSDRDVLLVDLGEPGNAPVVEISWDEDLSVAEVLGAGVPQDLGGLVRMRRADGQPPRQEDERQLDLLAGLPGDKANFAPELAADPSVEPPEVQVFRTVWEASESDAITGSMAGATPEQSLFLAMDSLTREFLEPSSEGSDARLNGMLRVAKLAPSRIQDGRPYARDFAEYLRARVRSRASTPAGSPIAVPTFRDYVGTGGTIVARHGRIAGLKKAARASSDLMLSFFGRHEPHRRFAGTFVPGLFNDPNYRCFAPSCALRLAFRAFSDGSLALRGRPNGEGNVKPDSAAYFSFGELALVLRDLDLLERQEQHRWRGLFLIFVESAEVFVSAFAPRGRPSRKYKDYNGTANAPADRRWEQVVDQAALTRYFNTLSDDEDPVTWGRLVAAWNRILRIGLFDEEPEEAG